MNPPGARLVDSQTHKPGLVPGFFTPAYRTRARLVAWFTRCNS